MPAELTGTGAAVLDESDGHPARRRRRLDRAGRTATTPTGAEVGAEDLHTLGDRRPLVRTAGASRDRPNACGGVRPGGHDVAERHGRRPRRAGRSGSSPGRGRRASGRTARRGGTGRSAAGRRSPRRPARRGSAPTTGPCRRSTGSARPAAGPRRAPAPRPSRATGGRRARRSSSGASSASSSARRFTREAGRDADVVQPARRRRAARAAASRRPCRPCGCGSRRPRSRRCATCFTFTSVRLSGVYGSSSRLATTPSRPAPSNSTNQRCGRRRGRWCSGTGAPARSRRPAAAASRARRSRSGASSNDSSSSASRSKATNDAGVSAASRRTRDSAGWMRCSSASKSRPRSSASGMTISPSTTQRSGSCGQQRLDQLGEVAGERPLVAAGQLDLVAVAEHDAAEAVPLRLVQPARRRPGSSSASLASIGAIGGAIGRVTPACQPAPRGQCTGGRRDDN